jgi:hypothetical protein
MHGEHPVTRCPSREDGDMHMSIHQTNNTPATTRQAPMPPLTNAAQPANGALPRLTLRIGSRLNPGLERRLRPNEDTLFVNQGSTLPGIDSPSQAFALLLIADGMGGQEHGQEASRLAAQSLVTWVLGPLCSQQGRAGALLSLLVAGVEQANQAVYQHNQTQETRMGTTMTAALVFSCSGGSGNDPARGHLYASHAQPDLSQPG